MKSLVLFTLTLFFFNYSYGIRGTQATIDAVNDWGNTKISRINDWGNQAMTLTSIKVLEPLMDLSGVSLIFAGDTASLLWDTLLQGSLSSAFSTVPGRCVPVNDLKPEQGPFRTVQPVDKDNYSGGKLTCFLVFVEEGIVISWLSAGFELGLGALHSLKTLNHKFLSHLIESDMNCKNSRQGPNKNCVPQILMVNKINDWNQEILGNLVGVPLHHMSENTLAFLTETFKGLENLSELKPKKALGNFSKVPKHLFCLSIGTGIEFAGELAEFTTNTIERLWSNLVQKNGPTSQTSEIDLSCENLLNQ